MPTSCSRSSIKEPANILHLLCVAVTPAPPLLSSAHILHIHGAVAGIWKSGRQDYCLGLLWCGIMGPWEYSDTNSDQFPLPWPNVWLAGSMTTPHLKQCSLSQTLPVAKISALAETMDGNQAYTFQTRRQTTCGTTPWRNRHGDRLSGHNAALPTSPSSCWDIQGAAV